MGYIQGEGRNQGTLFPVVLDDFVPADHVCRVIDSFVEKPVISERGFEHAQALRPLRQDDPATIRIFDAFGLGV
ncbi:MAG: family transposase [Edaphobacter sp.]|nr:family transposase [Edaphobacter sp.]